MTDPDNTLPTARTRKFRSAAQRDPMRTDALMRRMGSRWCEEHKRWECTRQRRNGAGTCHGVAITGTDRCRIHAGERADVARARGLANAWSALDVEPGEVDPGRLVLGVLAMSWARLHWIAGRLREQADPERPPVSCSACGEQQVEEVGACLLDFDGQHTWVEPVELRDGNGGLIGHTFGSTRAGEIFATGEALRGLVQLEGQERDRVVRFAKTAHDMGIAERETRLAEQLGGLVALVVPRLLDRLGLPPADRVRADEIVLEVIDEVSGSTETVEVA